MTLFWMSIICTSLMLIVVALYVPLMNMKHSKREKEETRLMVFQGDESDKIPDCIGQIVRTLIRRKKSYISNFITFQITNKIFGVGSVVYALLNFLSQTFLEETNDHSAWLNPTISFLSIIVVIVALYLSPTSRVSQYIEAWKKCDERMSLCIARCCLYKSWNKIVHTATTDDTIYTDTQSLILKESEDIANVITECEKLLSTDSE